MGKRLWPWILVVFALLISLLIRVPSQVSTAPMSSREFTFAINQSPNSLDPALANRSADRAITDNIFQTLLALNPNGQLIPDLARTVTVRGHVVQMVLARAHTSNGRLVTAAMVAESLSRPLWKSVHSSTARSLLASVVGFSQVVSGRRRYLSGVAVTAPQTLSVTLIPPANVSSFLRGLANPALAIVPIGDQSQGQAYWQYTNLIGTSPWTLRSWTPGSELIFRRSRPGPGPEEVVAAEYPHPQEAWLSVVNGLLNAAPVDPSQISRLRRPWQKDLHFFPMAGTVSLYFRFGDGHNSAYPKISMTHWIRRALGPKQTSLSKVWPTSLYSNRPMTIWVNSADGIAVALANTLSHMEPLVTVRETTAAHLAALTARNAITSYIGTRSRFAHSLALPLTPTGYFWLESPNVAAASTFPDGQLNWSSLRLGHR